MTNHLHPPRTTRGSSLSKDRGGAMLCLRVADHLEIFMGKLANTGDPSLTQLRFLEVLSEGPLRVSEIARTLGIQPATASLQLQKLERLGWVSRTRSDRDQRTVFAAITDEGQRTLKDRSEQRGEAVERYLQLIPEDNRARIQQAMHVIEQDLLSTMY